MNIRKIVSGTAVLFLMVLAFSSCKEDLNYLETDIVGGHNFFNEIDSATTVVAYSRRVNPVQTNALPVYRLGVYNDAVFGASNANVLAQVTLDEVNPSFGEDPQVEKVMLSIPYFSTASIGGELTTYTLDSVYGNTPIRLSVYESNYFLRNYDPDTGFEELQKYYSDQNAIFENFLGTLLYETDSFIPSNEEIVLNEDEEDEEGESLEVRLSPRMYVELPAEFFQEKIINQEGSNVLLNNNNFRDYFRGLYFKAEALKPGGNSFIFNILDAKIEIEYSYKKDDEDEERDTGTLGISFNGISVNTINTDIPEHIKQLLDNPNTTVGEENLYLKGGDGSIAIIELFGEDADGDGEPDQLTDLKNRNILINDAYLLFYVNQDVISGGSSEPDRIFIHDLNNKTVLLDYTLDAYTPETDLLNYKTNHLGRLERDSDKKGIKYKIRLTNYINSLVNKDSTNVRLGLSVSHNVRVTDFKSTRHTISPGFEDLPAGSVISPKGTVLYGSGSSNQNKKVKLYIHYTEVNN